MTRAYIRLDPAFDERKADYPDGPYAALVAVLCLAEHQPQRGRFRSLAYLRALMGRRGRHLPFLVSRGDVMEVDGRAYVDGWDEWQEGDWKVAERVERIRKRDHVTPPTVTGPYTSRLDSGAEQGVASPQPPTSGGQGYRADGTSPRQLRERADQARLEERERRRQASHAIHMRYQRGEINEDEEQRLYAELDMEPDDLRRKEVPA